MFNGWKHCLITSSTRRLCCSYFGLATNLSPMSYVIFSTKWLVSFYPLLYCSFQWRYLQEFTLKKLITSTELFWRGLDSRCIQRILHRTFNVAPAPPQILSALHHSASVKNEIKAGWSIVATFPFWIKRFNSSKYWCVFIYIRHLPVLVICNWINLVNLR